MIEWKYIVATLCLLLLVFLTWEEWRRKNKSMLGWRIAAVIVAVASLACMGLPVFYRQVNKAIPLNEVAVLTEGFNEDSLDNFLKKAGNTVPIFAIGENLHIAERYTASPIRDVALLTTNNHQPGAVHVFGSGLESPDLARLYSIPVIFHPSQPATGISSVYWDSKLKTGERLLVQGSVHNPLSKPLHVVLSGFGTTLDSTLAGSGSKTAFELAAVPKHTSRAIYTLAVLNGRDTIEKELLPVEVETGETLKILMLASSPDFENRFLKEYLSQHRYEVVVRTAISKNKFDLQYLNTGRFPLGRLTSSVLERFDIVIADATELASINQGEVSNIQSSVFQRGLGLIVKADSAVRGTAFFSRLFPINGLKDSAGHAVTIRLPDTMLQLPPLKMEDPLYIRDVAGTQPLATDKMDKVYVSSTLYGNGRIALTTLGNTYSWALSDKQEEYGSYWANLLNKVARKAEPEESWSVLPRLPVADRPVQLYLHTNNRKLPQASTGGVVVYMKANAGMNFEWSGTYWPHKSGWQPLIQSNGKTFWWYAYEKNDWKNITAERRTNATRQYVLRVGGKTVRHNEFSTASTKEFPKIYFLLAFILACSFLWFEKKFYALN